MLQHLTNNLKSQFAFIDTVHGGYLNSLTFSNVGELSRSWIPKKFPGSRREREMCRRFPTFSIIVKIRQFASYLCSDGKEMYKKSVLHVQSCCYRHPFTKFSWNRCTAFCVIWQLLTILPFLATDQPSRPLWVTQRVQALPTPGLSGEACEGTRVHLSWVKAIWSIAISP